MIRIPEIPPDIRLERVNIDNPGDNQKIMLLQNTDIRFGNSGRPGERDAEYPCLLADSSA